MFIKNIRQTINRVTESLRNKYMATPVIFDGDMGGDDIWAITMLLAHKDKFKLLGIATSHGNVSMERATRNILGWLNILGADNIEVAKGLPKSIDGVTTADDGGYGESGTGDVIFDAPSQKAHEGDIADWYKAKLEKQRRPVKLIVTGPATNVAYALQKYPELAHKISEIVFMGGAFNPPGKDGKPAKLENGEQRVGNITPHAEFNAYKDPHALNFFSRLDLPVTFVSADATQHLVLTPARQEEIKAMRGTYGDALHRMLMVVAHYDINKFGVDGPFIHDPNVITYLLRPDLYKVRPFGDVPVFDESKPDFDPAQPWIDHSARGKVSMMREFSSRVRWLEGMTDVEAVYGLMKSALEKTLSGAPAKERFHFKPENPAP